jgi:hypothetical protein
MQIMAMMSWLQRVVCVAAATGCPTVVVADISFHPFCMFLLWSNLQHRGAIYEEVTELFATMAFWQIGAPFAARHGRRPK